MTLTRLLLLVLLSLLLALSCSQKEAEVTTIDWWHFWTNPEVRPTIDRLVNDFEAVNPGVEIKLGDLTWSDGHEKIVISMAAGKGPDVIELGSDWVCEFAAAGKLLDITDRVADRQDDLLMWEPATYRRKIYGVPWMLGTRVLFCNRTLLEQVGSQYGPTGQIVSWDQLLRLARRINQLEDDTYGFGSNSAERHRLYKKYLPFFWSAGGEVFNADQSATQFDSEPGHRSLRFYLELAKTGIMETQARLDEYFAAGRIGFVISGEWLVRKLEKLDPKMDYFVSTLPGPTANDTGISFAGGEYLVINVNSDKQEIALALIRFLTQPKENQCFCRAAGSFTPANRYSLDPADTLLASVAAVFRRQSGSARPTPVHPAWVYIEEAIEKGIEQALYGELTVAEALLRIDRQCAAILQGHAVK